MYGRGYNETLLGKAPKGKRQNVIPATNFSQTKLEGGGNGVDGSPKLALSDWRHEGCAYLPAIPWRSACTNGFLAMDGEEHGPGRFRLRVWKIRLGIIPLRSDAPTHFAVPSRSQPRATIVARCSRDDA